MHRMSPCLSTTCTSRYAITEHLLITLTWHIRVLFLHLQRCDSLIECSVSNYESTGVIPKLYTRLSQRVIKIRNNKQQNIRDFVTKMDGRKSRASQLHFCNQKIKYSTVDTYNYKMHSILHRIQVDSSFHGDTRKMPELFIELNVFTGMQMSVCVCVLIKLWVDTLVFALHSLSLRSPARH